MATDTTFRAEVSPADAIRKRIDEKRHEGIETGMYLAAPTKEFAWYTVPATKASYLIDAADLPPPSVKPTKRPNAAELVVIMKVFCASLSTTFIMLKHLQGF